MKKTTTIIASAAALLAGTALVGSADAQNRVGPADAQERGRQAAQWGGPQGRVQRAHFGGPRAARFRRPGGPRFGLRLMERFDADKDGKLTQAELDKGRADQHAKFDADKDGKLNLAEYQAVWLDAMRERMVDAFQRHDDDGDAQVTVAEFGSRFAGLVGRLDSNQDGAFSRDDIGERRAPRRRGAPGGPKGG